MTDCVLKQVDVTTPDDVSIVFVPQVGPPVPGAGLPEAPVDGNTYGRRNGDWAIVAGSEGGAVTRDKIASGVLSGHRIVRDVDATHVGYVDTTNAAHAFDVLGMTNGAASSGADVVVVVDGDVTEPGWAWTPLQPVYVTGLGLLTQIPPTSPDAFSLEVGYATSATTMRVCIGFPITL